MSNLGISIKGRINSKKGAANPTCTQATRYSLLLTSDFLESASAEAEKKAQSRDNMNQFKANHQKISFCIVTFLEQNQHRYASFCSHLRNSCMGKNSIPCEKTVFPVCYEIENGYSIL